MSAVHKLELSDDEFETIHALVNGAMRKLDAMPRVNLTEPYRNRWLKILDGLKEKLWAERPPRGLHLGYADQQHSSRLSAVNLRSTALGRSVAISETRNAPIWQCAICWGGWADALPSKCAFCGSRRWFLQQDEE